VERQHEVLALTPLPDVSLERSPVLLGVDRGVFQELHVLARQIEDTSLFRLEFPNENIARDEAKLPLQCGELALDSLRVVQPFGNHLTSQPLTMAGRGGGGLNRHPLQLEELAVRSEPMQRDFADVGRKEELLALSSSRLKHLLVRPESIQLFIHR